MLSGIITTLLLQEHSNTGTIALRKFYARRVFRLLPALYVMLAGSIVAGALPSRPSSTARSVQCPRPVSASEPYICATTFAVCGSSPRVSSSPANAHAAFIGPIVWELDGPMPILKMSRTLRFMEYGRPMLPYSMASSVALPPTAEVLTV